MGRKVDTNDFINRSKKIHVNLYTYDNTIYINMKEKLLVTCKIHGDFLINPSAHLMGRKCGKCNGRHGGNYYKDGIPKYDLFVKEFGSVSIECRRNDTDSLVLEVKCHYCKKWHIPSAKSAYHKKASILGKENGEYNLYCSTQCKDECPTYHFNPLWIDPNSKIFGDAASVRRCQTKALKELQCQDNGYNYCEKCGDIIDVELHHTLKVSEHGKNAINSAGHILLCAGCHVELHRSCK